MATLQTGQPQPDVADEYKATGGFDVVCRSKNFVLTLT